MLTAAHSQAFDDYWKFAAKRHDAYLSRVRGEAAPWSDDPIINAYRFTNVYRAADRVTQFLIDKIQYNCADGMNDEDIVFRTLLFKLFNNINTWNLLERKLGQLRWRSFDFNAADQILEAAISSGRAIYSAAYIMPSPSFGAIRKHTNHLRLLKFIMEDRLTSKISSASSLEGVYHSILNYPGLGPFLAFQYAIDLNYSNMLGFDEDDFVVAGPGAHDGIRKCFPNVSRQEAENLIFWMVDNQDKEFARLNITFDGLFGRKLKAIDCQNIFCEISKYCRVAHPDIMGVTTRTRIKQAFVALRRSEVPKPFFPPKWNLKVSVPPMNRRALPTGKQLELYG